MIVRVRFGRGRLVTGRKGKNGKAARLLASFLTLVSLSFAIFGFWGLCEDMGFAGDFVFSDGILSHWQVWMAAAAAVQYGCWRLTRYSKQSDDEPDENPAPDGTDDDADKLTARI